MAPTITLIAPPTVWAGESTEVRMVVEADKPFDFEAIELEIIGREGWTVGSGRHLNREEHHYLQRHVPVGPPRGTLAAGRYEYTVPLEIPDTAPPSHDSSPAHASLRVRGIIRRKFPLSDWYTNGSIRVRRHTPGPIERTPVAPSSHVGEIQLSLASTRLAVGESIIGWVTRKREESSATQVSLHLVAVTTVFGMDRDGYTERAQWFEQTVVVAAGMTEQPIPFELALPPTMPPTFRSVSHERTWLLVARASFGWWHGVARIEVPLEIVDPGHSLPPAVDAVEVGAKKLSPVFAAFAEARGWQMSPHLAADAELGILRPSVSREEGGLDLELAVTYTGDGIAVLARAHFLSLGLGLEVEPSSPIRELLTRDVEADVPAWDRHHHVDATNREGAEALLTTVVPVLVAATSLGELVRWTDTEIVFTQPVTAIDAAELERIAAALIRVGTAIVGQVAESTPYR